MNATALSSQLGLWSMVSHAGPIVKLVLLLLLAFSIFSWAIIVYKLMLLKKIEKETGRFYEVFWEKRQFSHIASIAGSYRHTPLVPLFTAVYNELSNVMKSSSDDKTALGRENVDRIERILKKTGLKQSTRMEYAVSFLATAGNTAPFIGLFGTVWGIMTSFQDIGASGAANLAVVAPGISEALVATAMGLVVAIPAVVGYNHITTKINRVTSEMDNFSSDLLNIVAKQLSR
ncbi:MAG: protein TolQ [Thermodesulfobacteriota bacterium]